MKIGQTSRKQLESHFHGNVRMGGDRGENNVAVGGDGFGLVCSWLRASRRELESRDVV